MRLGVGSQDGGFDSVFSARVASCSSSSNTQLQLPRRTCPSSSLIGEALGDRSQDAACCLDLIGEARVDNGSQHLEMRGAQPTPMPHMLCPELCPMPASSQLLGGRGLKTTDWRRDNSDWERVPAFLGVWEVPGTWRTLR
ncbi:unnamed protein product [Natator depressus]